VSKILDINTFRGTVPKALEMSIAATRDLGAGLLQLTLSRMDWESEE